MPRKDPDYSKLKALHDSILDYIGDAEHVGENPSLPTPIDNDPKTSDFGMDDNNGDQDPQLNFIGNENNDGKEAPGDDNDKRSSDDETKKKKGSELAMYGAMLSRSMGK